MSDRTLPSSPRADDPVVADLLGRCTLPPAGTPVTCAVSGGADSSALLALAVAAGLDVTAVHVDHGLRPGSAHEAEGVQRLASRWGAAFRSEQVRVPRRLALPWMLDADGAMRPELADHYVLVGAATSDERLAALDRARAFASVAPAD